MIMAAASIIGALADVTKLFDTIGKVTGKTNGDLFAKTLKELKVDNTTVDLIKANGNMISFMSKYIVEIPIIVTKDMYSRNDIDKVIEHTIDVYSSFYLRTFNILTNMYHLEGQTAINLLNSKVDLENYGPLQEGLTTLENVEKFSLGKTSRPDLEAIEASVEKETTWVEDTTTNSKTIIRNINLTCRVGSKISIKDSIGGDDENIIDNLTVNIPIIIKANVMVSDFSNIVNGISHLNSNTTFFKRLLQYRVGLISFWNLFTANDLVEKYKTESLSKENISAILNKASTNHFDLGKLLDKKVGLNKIVFSYIMSDMEYEKLGKASGYDFRKNKGKDELMNATLALNITTINPDRDIVTIYLNGIGGMASSAISKLSKSGTKDNSDMIAAMALALMSNKPIL